MTGVTPRIFREGGMGRFFIRRINHEHRLALGITQWPTQNDEAIGSQSIHVLRVLVPEQLRPQRLISIPSLASNLADNE